MKSAVLFLLFLSISVHVHAQTQATQPTDAPVLSNALSALTPIGYPKEYAEMTQNCVSQSGKLVSVYAREPKICYPDFQVSPSERKAFVDSLRSILLESDQPISPELHSAAMLKAGFLVWELGCEKPARDRLLKIIDSKTMLPDTGIWQADTIIISFKAKEPGFFINTQPEASRHPESGEIQIEKNNGVAAVLPYGGSLCRNPERLKKNLERLQNDWNTLKELAFGENKDYRILVDAIQNPDSIFQVMFDEHRCPILEGTYPYSIPTRKKIKTPFHASPVELLAQAAASKKNKDATLSDEEFALLAARLLRLDSRSTQDLEEAFEGMKKLLSDEEMAEFKDALEAAQRDHHALISPNGIQVLGKDGVLRDLDMGEFAGMSNRLRMMAIDSAMMDEASQREYRKTYSDYQQHLVSETKRLGLEDSKVLEGMIEQKSYLERARLENYRERYHVDDHKMVTYDPKSKEFSTVELPTSCSKSSLGAYQCGGFNPISNPDPRGVPESVQNDYFEMARLQFEQSTKGFLMDNTPTLEGTKLMRERMNTPMDRSPILNNSENTGPWESGSSAFISPDGQSAGFGGGAEPLR